MTGFESIECLHIVVLLPLMLNTFVSSANRIILFWSSVKAGFHLREFGRAIARLVVWACAVCFNDEDTPVIGDRVTDFGSWIDLKFLRPARAEPIKLLQFCNNYLISMPGLLVAQLAVKAFES